jgi:hypothetical protein
VYWATIDTTGIAALHVLTIAFCTTNCALPMSSVYSLNVSSSEISELFAELSDIDVERIGEYPHIDEALTRLAKWDQQDLDEALAVKWIGWLDKASTTTFYMKHLAEVNDH